MARVDRAIKITSERVLDKDVNNAWQVVHGIIAYGADLNMQVGEEQVKALPWLFAGNIMDGWDLFPGEKGLDAFLDPGSSVAQGHPDQWIGYLACCGVKLDEPIIVNVKGEKKTYRFRDMLEEAKWKMLKKEEWTWTVMALAAYVGPDYLPIDGTWMANDGQEWSLEKLIGLEVDEGIEGAACGGAHRLYALALAVKQRRDAGLAMIGNWARAEELVKNSIAAAFRFQQPDGGFSNDRFVRSSISPDIDTRIDSTGHVLEVLAFAVDANELKSQRMTRAVEFLCKKIEDSQNIDLSCGGLYHGAHGLMIYRERRFGKPEAKSAE
jgi:hypothetical protein